MNFLVHLNRSQECHLMKLWIGGTTTLTCMHLNFHITCLLRTSGSLIRFIDHDMFMKFHGGGVGHKATNTHTSNFHQDFPENNPASSSAADLNSISNVPIDNEEAQLIEEEDYRYSIEHSEGEGEGEGEEMDDMGAEDGETLGNMDNLEAEGYSKL